MVSTTHDAAGEALTSALGTAHVRPADPGTSAAGRTPRWIVTASSTEQISTALRLCGEHGLAVVPKGSGSKLDWGARPTGADVLLDTSANTGVREHAAGDLVVHARAGTPLSEVNASTRVAGQQLAIDHPLPGATLGGIVATAAGGPCRHLFGGVRDLLIGITAVLADGTVATSGGKVVKNVAGYDLGKLYTGSWGTLGVITETIFRLHPLAEEHRWVSITCPDPADAATAAEAVRRSQAMPTAVEIDRPAPGAPAEVCAQLEGRADATGSRAQHLADRLGGRVLDAAPPWWAAYPFDPATGIGIRVGFAPARVDRLLRLAEESPVPPAVRGAAGLGVLHLGLPGDAPAEHVAELLTQLRADCDYAAIERAPAAVHALADPFGDGSAGLRALLRRTKDQFDPQHNLAPGRHVGGTR
ncbi:FAD-binding oxidoreductase [Saccharopolyspora sp. HNM0983]|uniref:FAD-binding oxidoreductase n=1 Tax=Saccharopolyspora montiporae TaxID=2781240 RepID=A0A929B9K6_9PSEU|nr:FAD-binding oxidoreductase [Saccharopolyspora sp. HNM0983]MBE9375797.1 FAD-binding oxidoreductase [Saccharopolyspora sp. HNM0983]